MINSMRLPVPSKRRGLISAVWVTLRCFARLARALRPVRPAAGKPQASHRGVVCAVLTGLTVFGGLGSAEKPTVGEYQVKAAFLYHFTKFVEWPTSSVSHNLTTVCVLGDDPFGPMLDFTFEDKTVRGLPFEVRRLGNDADLGACQVLFLSASETGAASTILGALQGLPVLTVADAPEFGQAGGMIQLVVEESKVRFDINLAVAKRSRLRISAQLLHLARRVDGK
jgi:hypothetical protein